MAPHPTDSEVDSQRWPPLPVLSAGSGARVSEIVVNHRPRTFGKSKYGLSRASRVLIDFDNWSLLCKKKAIRLGSGPSDGGHNELKTDATTETIDQQ
jgi:hypothetical protein